jgi:hypothetical protein
MKFKLLFGLFWTFCSVFSSFAQVIDYSTNIYFDDENLVVKKSYVINIQGIDQRQAADVSIYLGSNAEFELLYAEIYNSEGELLRKLKKKDLHEVSAISRVSFYQDDKFVKFSMQWDQYPFQIRYAYEKRYAEFINIAYWTPIVFEGMTTLKGTLSLLIPQDYKINIYASDELDFSDVTEEDGLRKLTWSSTLSKYADEEVYSIPEWEIIPKVIVVPDKFKYHSAGSSSTWADFGKWKSDINLNNDDLPLSEKKIIDSLIVDCKTKKDVVSKLYRYLQDNTHYVFVSIDYGGLKSYPASYVCQNKYGDCKALSTYMKAILKYAGIESFYTSIKTGLNEARIIKSIPSQQFNHIIVCVPLEEDTLWLENTSSTLPYDYLSIRNQNRYVLISDGDNSSLVRTPAFSVDDNMEYRKINFYLDEDGEGSFSAENTIKGYLYEKFSYIDSEWEDKYKKEELIDCFKLQDVMAEDWKIDTKNKDKHSINLSLQGQTQKKIKNIGHFKAIMPLSMKIPEFEKPKDRKQALRFNYPLNKLDSLIYHLPFLDSYHCQLPESVSIESKFGSFKISAAKTDNSIKIYRHWIIFTGDYGLEEYPDFYTFVQQVEDALKKSVTVLEKP